MVALVQLPGALLGEGVTEGVVPLLKGEAGGLLAPEVRSAGKVDLSCDSGTTGTPSVGAESMTTPTAP